MPEWSIRKGDMLTSDSSAEASDGKKAIAEMKGEIIDFGENPSPAATSCSIMS